MSIHQSDVQAPSSAARASTTSGEAARHRLHELVEGVRFAMLVTSDEGELEARPMTIAEVGSDNLVCFAASFQSKMVERIRKNPRVLVTSQTPTRYIAFGGLCAFSNDQKQIDRLWSESWRAWFPNGKSDSNIALVQLRIDNGEYWEFEGTKGVKFLWQATKAYFSGDGPASSVGTHGKI